MPRPVDTGSGWHTERVARREPREPSTGCASPVLALADGDLHNAARWIALQRPLPGERRLFRPTPVSPVRRTCLYQCEGLPERAVALYRSLLKAEPTLEDVVRELYRCYQETGDLSSLIREDRHLRQALREAYHDPADPDDLDQYHPEPETVARFNQIRAHPEARTARAATSSGSRER
jgi:hypothetical protein